MRLIFTKWFAVSFLVATLSGVVLTGCGTDTTTEIDVTEQEPPADDPAANTTAPTE
jgi:hypothetical protein